MRLPLIFRLILGLFLESTISGAVNDVPPKRGDIIFETGFEDTNTSSSPTARWGVGFNSPKSILVERSNAESAEAASVEFSLPHEKVRGCVLHVNAMVKAENVSEKPQPSNGIKLMVHASGNFGNQWPQATIATGSFDWKNVVFAVRVPDDVEQLSLIFGLESVSGKVWFDDVRVVVRKPPPRPRQRTPETPYKGHDLPRLRGVMVAPNIDEEGLRILGKEWNANLIRWQFMGWSPEPKPLEPGLVNAWMKDQLEAYSVWLEGQMSKLDAVLPWCRKYGLMVVVDLHNGPYGSTETGADLFTDVPRQRKLVESWQCIARRYLNCDAIWAYDLVNEPTEDTVADDCMDWSELAEQVAREIRAIDPKRTIIVEPVPGGEPYGLAYFQPIDVVNVVYSVHMYRPHAFTHQLVSSRWNREYSYPGEIEGTLWNRAQVEVALSPVIEFQRKYGAHIFIGEFSAVRWAPNDSAYRYLKDIIEIFENNGWDWTYHAFRESRIWSVEHGPEKDNIDSVPTPTNRELLLKEWFEKNQKPRLMLP